MVDQPRGSIKTFVESISVSDNSIGNILKTSLSLAGFDLEIRPTKRVQGYYTGETIKIYRTELPIIEPINPMNIRR